MHSSIRRVGDCYLAASAVVEGDVELAAGCNLWHYTVLRGDVAPIRLGPRVNIQDGSLLHCNTGVPLVLEEDVVLGHHAIVHGRRVGARTLIGIRATVLDDAVVGSDCLVAAGAVVPPGLEVPDGSVVMGIPGRVVRPIRDDERSYIRRVTQSYLELAERHARGEFPAWGE